MRLSFVAILIGLLLTANIASAGFFADFFHQLFPFQNKNIRATICLPFQGCTGTSTTPTADQILIGGSNSRYDVKTLTAGSNITIATSSGAVMISSSGGGGSGVGTISTSSAPTLGQLSYWTSSGAWPETLGKVATTSLTATSPLSLSQPVSVIGSAASALTIDTTGDWAGTLDGEEGSAFHDLTWGTTYNDLSLTATTSESWWFKQPIYASSTGIFSSYVDIGNNSSYKIGGNNILTASSTTYNTLVGQEAGNAITNGSVNNTFLGYRAGYSNNTGDYNTFLGYGVGYSNTLGSFGTFVGNIAGYANTEGEDNVFIGHNAGRYNTTGSFNNFLGYGSGLANVIGNYNTYLGQEAGGASLGSNNVFIGASAGQNSSTGEGSIFIGYQAGVNETNSNRLYIENSNSATPLIWGDFANDLININGKFGVGTSSPYAKLSVVGEAVASHFTATTTATSTFPNISISGAISLLGEYFTNFTTYVRSLFTGGNHITITNGDIDVDDDFLLNTGDIGTGVYDFGGATSLELPNGSPTVDTTGEIGIDTTSGQLKWSYNGASIGVQPPYHTMAFSYSTTSAWTGTTTKYLAPAMANITVINAKCEVNPGTLNVSLYDGTNRADLINASSTIGTFTYSTNNTFTSSESIRVDIGTPATSPLSIGCRFKFTYDPD